MNSPATRAPQRLQDRREFLRTAALGSAALVGLSPSRRAEGSLEAVTPPPGLAGTAPDVAFLVVSDTHYFADEASPGRIDPRSEEITSRFIATLEALAGVQIPEALGGGVVHAPVGVLHGGDLIDSGDKNGRSSPAMQETELAAFARDFGVTGKDARLRLPVYEVHGNHDSPSGDGLVVRAIEERNRRRPGLAGLSQNGLHYSWDWGPAHFVNLGITVAPGAGTNPRRRYNPLESLDFLVEDLAEHARDGRPVILTHHVDVARYTNRCADSGEVRGEEWDPCDVVKYFGALGGHNIAAIFYGHTHSRRVFRWDAQGVGGDCGLAVFNVDNASHYNDDTGAFFYVELRGQRMLVREYATKDRWQTASWSPQWWDRPLGRVTCL